MAEVAAQTARTPRQVYAEESVRTMFLTWACVENGRARPLQALVDAFSGPANTAPTGALESGRTGAAAEAVRAAAERAVRAKASPPVQAPPKPPALAPGASTPPPPADPVRLSREAWWAKIAARRAAALRSGPSVSGNAVVVHVDDPGAMAAYNGQHGMQRRIAAAQDVKLPGRRR